MALQHYQRWIEAFDRLTERERQVVDLMVEGCANKDIATRLAISRRTVEVHRSHVMAKLELTSVAKITEIYMQIYKSIS